MAALTPEEQEALLASSDAEVARTNALMVAPVAPPVEAIPTVDFPTVVTAPGAPLLVPTTAAEPEIPPLPSVPPLENPPGKATQVKVDHNQPSIKTQEIQQSPKTASEMDKMSSAVAEQTASRTREADLRALAAEHEAVTTQQMADQKRLDDIEKERRRAAAKPLIEAANAKVDKRIAQMEAAAEASGRGFWEDRSAPARIFSAFLVGAGQMDAGLSGTGKNGALEVLNRDMKQDREDKLNKFKASKDLYEISKLGPARVRQALVDELREIDMQDISKLEHLRGETVAFGKKTNSPIIKEQAQQFNAHLEEQVAEKKAKLYQHNERTVMEAVGGGQETDIYGTLGSGKGKGGGGGAGGAGASAYSQVAQMQQFGIDPATGKPADAETPDRRKATSKEIIDFGSKLGLPPIPRAAHGLSVRDAIKDVVFQDHAEAGSGRAANLETQKATLAGHAGAALAVVDAVNKKGVFLTEKDRVDIQNTKNDVEIRHEHPLASKFVPKGILARGPYQNLPADKQKLAQAYDVLRSKFAAIVSISHDANMVRHAQDLADPLQPGVTPEALEQTMDYMREVVGAAKAAGGKKTKLLAEGAEKELAAAPGRQEKKAAEKRPDIDLAAPVSPENEVGPSAAQAAPSKEARVRAIKRTITEMKALPKDSPRRAVLQNALNQLGESP